MDKPTNPTKLYARCVSKSWVMRRIVAMQSYGLVYRIFISPTHGHVTTAHFGTDSVDNELESTYDNVQALPKWVQGRIAVLSMTDAVHNGPVSNVGERASADVYYVYGHRLRLRGASVDKIIMDECPKE
jgi:hypothetical protein